MKQQRSVHARKLVSLPNGSAASRLHQRRRQQQPRRFLRQRHHLAFLSQHHLPAWRSRPLRSQSQHDPSQKGLPSKDQRLLRMRRNLGVGADRCPSLEARHAARATTQLRQRYLATFVELMTPRSRSARRRRPYPAPWQRAARQSSLERMSVCTTTLRHLCPSRLSARPTLTRCLLVCKLR